MGDSIKVLLLLSLAFLMITLENVLKGSLPVSGLIGIMSMSTTILQQYEILAKRLAVKFNKLWVVAILITAPIGAIGIDKYYKRLLSKC